jgi:hypothetical protein
MFRDQLLGDTEVSDNMVKKEVSGWVGLVNNDLHRLSLLFKVTDDQNDVFMTTIG